MTKFSTEFQYAGIFFIVNGTVSCDDEIEIDSVCAWDGNSYTGLDVETDLFLDTMEDYIRESIEQDVAASRDAYFEDKYDEQKLEGL